MFVVDASAAYDAVAFGSHDIGGRLLAAPGLFAPYLLDVEVASALRRDVRLGTVSADRGTDVLESLRDLPLTRYAHEPLLDRAWELRDRLSAYDAIYLALAEELSVSLITCDARLATVAQETVAVELFPPASA